MTLKKIYDKLEYVYARRNSQRHVSYWRKRGAKIGENVVICSAVVLDRNRTPLIEIGDNCFLNHGTQLIAHDFVSGLFRVKYGSFINSSGKIKIGNNVHFGRNVTVLKGVEIGDNCFIGFGSVVMKNIPANSVAAGTPAKVICSIDDYFEKRKKACINEAFEYARCLEERFNRRPAIEDFREEFPLFVSGNEVNLYPTLPIKYQLGVGYDKWIKEHKKTFNSFDDFLEAAGVKSK